MASMNGEALVQFQDAAFAPQTKNFDVSTEGINAVLVCGAGDANTTVQYFVSFDGGATYPLNLGAAAAIPGVATPAIVKVPTTRLRIQVVQATTTPAVRIVASGMDTVS